MKQTSRRALLGAGASAAFLAPFAWARPAAAGFSTTTGSYARSRFAPLLNRSFRLASATGSWSVTLAEVTDLPHAPGGDNDRFGLTFRSSVAGPPQGTYTLRRFRFTPTTLFVVPSDASHLTYEAVINRAS